MSRLDALASPNTAIYVDRMRDGRISENTKFLQSDAAREQGKWCRDGAGWGKPEDVEV